MDIKFSCTLYLAINKNLVNIVKNGDLANVDISRKEDAAANSILNPVIDFDNSALNDSTMIDVTINESDMNASILSESLQNGLLNLNVNSQVIEKSSSIV